MRFANLQIQYEAVYNITQECKPENLKTKLREGLKQISQSPEGSKILKNLYGISGVLDLDGLFDPVREAAKLLNMDLGK